MLKKFIVIVTLFALTTCDKGSSEKSENITINPFQLFTSDFSMAREQNDVFQEWTISNFPLGIHKCRIFNENRKDSVYCICSGSVKFPAALHFQAQYGIPLPDSAKKMNIYLEYGCQSISNAEFLVSISFLNKTILLTTKTTPLEPTFSKNDNRPRIIGKEIELNVPSFANNIQIQIEAERGIILLSKCDIKINGKDIEKYSFEQTLPFTSSELKRTDSIISSRLKIPDSVKIIGIGESLHGSMEFIQQATTIIQEKISMGGNYILLLEASPLLGYQINQYIHGESTDLTDLVIMAKNDYNSSCFIEFLDTIKKYNRDDLGKIIVVGYETGINISLDTLFAKVVAIFPESVEIRNCLPLLTKLAIQNERKEVYALTEGQKKQIRLHLEMAKKKASSQREFYESYFYSYLLERVNTSGSLYDINMKYMLRRDSLMARNVCYLLKQLPDNYKTIVHGHLGHIARHREKRELKGNSTSSLGYYLSQEYGNNYKVVGLFTGCGEVWTGRYEGYALSIKKGIYPVTQPMGNSLEQLCNALDTTSFYLNNIKDFPLLDKIDYERSMGAFWRPMQFEPTFLRQELDAIWFTPRSTAL